MLRKKGKIITMGVLTCTMLFASVTNNAALGSYTTSDARSIGSSKISSIVTCEPAAIGAFVASVALAANLVTLAWNFGNSVGAALAGRATGQSMEYPQSKKFDNLDFSEFDS